MGLSFGATGVPSVPAGSYTQAAVPPAAPAANATSGPVAMAVAHGVALRVLMLSQMSPQALSIYVARSTIPPAPPSNNERDKQRLRILRSVKQVAKSEAMGQQTQNR